MPAYPIPQEPCEAGKFAYACCANYHFKTDAAPVRRFIVTLSVEDSRTLPSPDLGQCVDCIRVATARSGVALVYHSGCTAGVFGSGTIADDCYGTVSASVTVQPSADSTYPTA